MCIRDSMDIFLDGPSGEIRGLSPGRFEDWDLTSLGLQANIGLALRNVLVHDWRPGLYNCSESIALVDSSMGNVSIVNLGGTAIFRGCSIGGMQIDRGYGTLQLLDSSIETGFSVRDSWLTLEGEFSFSEEAVAVWEDGSTIVRTFEIRVVDPAEAGVPGVQVERVGPGAEASSAITGPDGIVRIWANFGEYAGDNRMTVTAYPVEGDPLETEVTLFSSDVVTIRLAD